MTRQRSPSAKRHTQQDTAEQQHAPLQVGLSCSLALLLSCYLTLLPSFSFSLSLSISFLSLSLSLTLSFRFSVQFFFSISFFSSSLPLLFLSSLLSFLRFLLFVFLYLLFFFSFRLLFFPSLSHILCVFVAFFPLLRKRPCADVANQLSARGRSRSVSFVVFS